MVVLLHNKIPENYKLDTNTSIELVSKPLANLDENNLNWI
jgi:hypothetical protein